MTRRKRQNNPDFLPVWKQVLIAAGMTLLLTSLAVVVRSQGTTYYCSPTGSWATGDGSSGNPWGPVSEFATYSGLYDAGDNLIATDGYHGDVYVTGHTKEVYITAQNPLQASFSAFRFGNGNSDIHINGFDIWPWASGSYISRSPIVGAPGSGYVSSNITIQNCHIYRADNPWTTFQAWNDSAGVYGIRSNGSNWTLINNEIEQTNMGIYHSATNSLISGNRIDGYNDDGMHIEAGSNGTRILYNTIINLYESNPAYHNDIIQIIYSDYSDPTDIEIGWNIGILEEAGRTLLTGGSLQGIVMFNDTRTPTMEGRNLHIHHNFIKNTHSHGISLRNIVDSYIYANVSVDSDTTDASVPGLYVYRYDPADSCNNNVIVGNSMIAIDVTDSDNSIIDDNYDFAYADQWDLVVDFDGDDYHLADENQPVVDLLDSTLVTAFGGETTDIDGNAITGVNMDAWAYEYDSGYTPEPETATTFYVGTGGNDSNDGTTYPTRRLTETGIDAITESGDTVHVYGIVIRTPLGGVTYSQHSAAEWDGRESLSGFIYPHGGAGGTGADTTITLDGAYYGRMYEEATWADARDADANEYDTASYMISGSAQTADPTNLYSVWRSFCRGVLPSGWTDLDTLQIFLYSLVDIGADDYYMLEMPESYVVREDDEWDDYGHTDGAANTNTKLAQYTSDGSADGAWVRFDGTPDGIAHAESQAGDTLAVALVGANDYDNTAPSAAQQISMQFDVADSLPYVRLVQAATGDPDSTRAYLVLTGDQRYFRRLYIDGALGTEVAYGDLDASGEYHVNDDTLYVHPDDYAGEITITGHQTGIDISANDVEYHGAGYITLLNGLEGVSITGTDAVVDGVVIDLTSVPIRAGAAVTIEHVTVTNGDSMIYANIDLDLSIITEMAVSDTTGEDADQSVFYHATATDGADNLADTDPQLDGDYQPQFGTYINAEYAGAVSYDESGEEPEEPAASPAPSILTRQLILDILGVF